MTKIALSNNAPTILPPTLENIKSAAYMLHQGELVAFPTETVYGLGARVDDADAVARIYALKGRPAHNPLIVHVANSDMAARYGVLTRSANILMQHFFPAPLTVIVPVRKGSVAEAVLAGGDSVALRAPAHPIALALIGEATFGVAAPSANRSGRISPTSANHVASEFATSGLSILDGGSCTIGLESTVVDCREDGLRILRYGAITQDEIEAILGKIDSTTTQQETLLRSPGLLSSHYAPACKVRLGASDIEQGEVALNFGKTLLHSPIITLNLSENGLLEEAAYHLYDYLRQLDALIAQSDDTHTIAIAPIPEYGIGIAINDRLRRAAFEKV
jgi:L-threonylcarbamoyladenylate synthase